MNLPKKIAVIGAGQMGSGIAQVFVQAGFETVLFDGIPAALERGFNGIHSNIKKAIEKGKMNASDGEKALSLLTKGSSISSVSGADFVVEAIIEQFEPKAALFKELDALLAPHAIIASNTSSISVTKMAATTKRPEKFVGMHFMNPVPVMQLVELIRGIQCSDETYAITKELVAKLGKTSVLALDSPGFIVNRILVPMVNEAIYLLQEGVTAADIDAAMKLGTNQPMGPLTLADFVGLDTLLYILEVLHKELGEDKYRPCPLLRKYVEAGWFGKKVGRGFYTY